MTHDFSVTCWGHNYNIMDLRDKGLSVSLSGWSRGINSGDFLILKNGSGTTRYLVESIRYEDNPDDMWFAEASFAPRDFEGEE